MAHPLSTGESVSAGPGIILKRPELAALIGTACSDWAYTEMSLGNFYGHLMGVYLVSPPGFEPPSHPVAHQIFDEIQTIHSRVQLVKKLVDWVIKDVSQKEAAQKVLERIRKAGKGRNRVAHAVWGICDSQPEALILIPTFGTKLIFKKKDFEAILKQIREANAELMDIHYTFYKSRKE